MTTKRRWLRRLILISLLLLSSLVFLLSTTPGLYASLYLVEKFTGSHIQYESLSGRIIGHLKMKNFVYSHHDDLIRLGQLDLKWQPLWLLFGSVDIRAMQLKDAYIRYSSDDESVSEDNGSIEDKLIGLLSHEIKNTEINKLTVINNNQTLLNLTHAKINIDSGFSDWEVKTFDIKLSDYHLSAKGSIKKRAPYSVKLDVSADAHTQLRRPFQSQLSLSGSLSNLKFESQIKTPFNASLDGQINLEKAEPSIDVTGNWKALRWPLVGAKQYYSKRGQLRITGLLHDYQLQLQTRVQGTQLPDTSIELAGHGNLSLLRLDTIALKSLSGTVTGKAVIPFQRGQTLINLNARNLNPGIKWPQFTGALNFDLRLLMHRNESTVMNVLDITKLSGNLHQHPVSGELHFKQDNKSFVFKQSAIKVGQNSLSVNGGYTDRWNLNWNASLPSLKSIDAQMKGRIHSTGRVTGPQGKADIQIVANARGVNYGSKIVNQIDFNAMGNMAAHELKLFIGDPKSHLNASAKGEYRSGLTQLTMTQLDLIGLDKDDWHLKSASAIKISEAQTIIPKHCLNSGEQTICLNQLTIKPDAWRVDFEIDQLNPQILQYITPRPVVIHGELNASASFRSQYGIASGVASMNFKKGRIEYTSENQTHVTPFDFANMKAELNKSGLYSYLNLQLSSKHTLKAELNLPDQIGFNAPDSSQRIQSQARMDITDFSWLDALIPHVDQIKGQGKLMMTLEGSLGKPKINADVDIKNASLDIPDLGTTVQNIHLEGRAKNSNVLSFQGSAKAGPGQLTVNGLVKLENMVLHTETKAKADNILAVKTHEFTIFASPDINITTNNHEVEINGDININKADIMPQDFGSTLKLPDDVVIIQRIESRDKARIRSDINIDLGDNTRLSFLGLKGKVVGKINIVDAPDKEPVATGQLSIKEGKYTAYGQDLTIEQGNLFYTGNRLDTPGINVKASRTIESFDTGQVAFPNISNNIATATQTSTPSLTPTMNKLTVGVKVTGSLDAPRITLYSEPVSLPQSDILSYLLLGRPVRSVVDSGDSNGQDTQMLFGALSALNLGGHSTEQVTSQIEKTLGIDRLEVTTTTVPDPTTGVPLNNTAIVVGKAITPRLYVDYTVGLIETLNLIRISYRLSKNWVLQSQTGNNNNSIDLLYTIEK